MSEFRANELLYPFASLPEEIAVVDLETTGLFDEEGAPGCASIGVQILSDEFEESAEYLVKPHREMTEEASNVNGFTNAEVMRHPKFADQWEHVLPWVEGKVVVIHNAGYDWNILMNSVSLYGLSMPKVKGVFCSQRAAQAWASINGVSTSQWGPSLDKLVAFLGIANLREINQGKHSAALDAEMAGSVVRRLRGIALQAG